MSEDIRQWLEDLGLGEYAKAFVENKIDASVLRDLTNDDLRDIGVVAVGDRRKLLAAISRFGSESEPVVQSPEEALDASRRQVTVLFADLAGFTALSSRLDAEETHALLNRFFGTVDEVVRESGGSIDKHIGDAVMAVFGAPVAHTDDPERALRAALGIHDAVAALEPPLSVHVGVASGEVVASTTGSTVHTEYTVTGDSVNLAARLTGLAQTGETLASASVRRALGERFDGESLEEQLIAGLPEPVTVWRLKRIIGSRRGALHPFVGRRRELSRFRAAIDHCLDRGSGETLMVRGEAGIGKTRLLEEFERVAAENGFASHTGLVLDFGTAKGQDAIRSLVRSLLNIAPGSGEDARRETADSAVAEGLLAEDHRVFLNDLLDIGQPTELRGIYDAMDNQTRNRGKQESLEAMVRTLSEQQPLLLNVEDLHWADSVVLAHAAHLACTVAACRSVLLLTTRLSGDPLDENWRATSESATIGVIDLGPMAATEAADLAHTFEGVDEGVVQTCIERAGGNPLFLEQLFRNVDELGGSNIPGTVQGIVQARMDALPARDRRCLQAASVLGQRFSEAAVSAMIEQDDYRPQILLRQALIRPAGDDYQFAHALIRDGVYASLLKPQRIALHRQAAVFFRDSDSVLYAEHLDRAEDAGAPEAYFAAARQLRDGFHYDTALRLISRALELASPPAARFELICFQADLLRDLGETDDSIAAYEQALEIASEDELLCRANLGLAAGMRIADRNEEAMACLDRAQAVATDKSFEPLLAELHFLRGNLYFPLGRIAECRKEHETSVEYARRTGSRQDEARALGGLGDASYVAGHMRTANRNFARCVEIAQHHGLTRIAVANQPMLAWTEFFLNRMDEANETAQSAVHAAVATGDGRAEIIAHNILAEIFYARGKFEDANLHGEKTLTIARRIGATRFEAIGLFNRARYRLHLGHDSAAALASYREAYAICLATAESFSGPWILGGAAVLASKAEDRKWALKEGERILDAGAVSHNYLFFQPSAMEACLGSEDWDEVTRYAEALETYTAEEPLEWSDFHIRRGRALADFGRGKRDQEMIGELEHLRDTARSVGLDLALTRIEAALAEIDK